MHFYQLEEWMRIKEKEEDSGAFFLLSYLDRESLYCAFRLIQALAHPVRFRFSPFVNCVFLPISAQKEENERSFQELFQICSEVPSKNVLFKLDDFSEKKMESVQARTIEFYGKTISKMTKKDLQLEEFLFGKDFGKIMAKIQTLPYIQINDHYFEGIPMRTSRKEFMNLIFKDLNAEYYQAMSILSNL
jgi:hypothetical protein